MHPGIRSYDGVVLHVIFVLTLSCSASLHVIYVLTLNSATCDIRFNPFLSPPHSRQSSGESQRGHGRRGQEADVYCSAVERSQTSVSLHRQCGQVLERSEEREKGWSALQCTGECCAAEEVIFVTMGENGYTVLLELL